MRQWAGRRAKRLRITRGRASPSRSRRSTSRSSELPEPTTRGTRLVRRAGLAPIDGGPRRPPSRLPSLDPAPAQAVARHRVARRIGLGVAGVLGVGLTALAAHRIGVQNVVASVVRSDAGWVLIATGLMMASMLMRAVSWYAIARAALPRSPLRRRDVTSATMIGVLMSATLPARLGEPARAMVLSRRTGRMRETFPVLLGTLVSQTALNILALALLGAIIVASTDLFHSSSQALFIFSLAPLRVAGRGRPCAGGRAAERFRALGAPGGHGARGAGSRPHRPSGLPRSAAWVARGRGPARGVGRSSCSPARPCSRRLGFGAASGPLPRCCSRST